MCQFFCQNLVITKILHRWPPNQIYWDLFLKGNISIRGAKNSRSKEWSMENKKLENVKQLCIFSWCQKTETTTSFDVGIVILSFCISLLVNCSYPLRSKDWGTGSANKELSNVRDNIKTMFCGRDLWWTIPLHIFHWSCWDTLVFRLYSEIDHLHLSSEAKCVSHLFPLGDCHNWDIPRNGAHGQCDGKTDRHGFWGCTITAEKS